MLSFISNETPFEVKHFMYYDTCALKLICFNHAITLVFYPLSSEKKKGCFPSMAKVNLENGGRVTMSELQIGDHVQAGGLEIFSLILNSYNT